MFKKKQNKVEEPFTPRDLDSLSAKGWRNSRGIRRDAKEMTRDEKRRRRARWLIIILIAIIIILWLLSCMTTQFGDLVVSVDKDLEGKGVILSETIGFENPQVTLDGGSVKDVYHYTYDWFESRDKVLDKLDNIDGSHNGENYFAYTFYIKNNGTETFDYNATLEITGVAKSCDEAARIMVYKNGEPTIYAKPVLGTTDTAEFVSHEQSEKAVLFHDNDTVYTETLKDFSPGDVDKYTVVIWFEGEDSECINDIMGGHMRLAMNFEAAELE